MKRSTAFLCIVLSLFIALQGYSQRKTKHTKHTSTHMKTRKVLFVVTSYGEIQATGHKTGIWLEELASPYYLLFEQDIEVVIASPKGGKAPIDPKSLAPDYVTASVKRFQQDADAQKKLDNTIALTQVKASDYDAIFYPGGHGPMWDLPENTQSIQLIESFYAANKPVALVCHAPAALKNVKGKDGAPLIKGKKVTGYSNSEEVAGNSTQECPFPLEDMLKEKGGNYESGGDWKPFLVTDGRLITGQNPASSELVATEILSQLGVTAKAK
ncbi:type 1 glutamine amidotransferase domain-containing protein [Cytophagaceae bacterium YF14B1]|uniref:Type 1 glutamine amidotransferase domain-containing protein n=2 Tax=Xanthocytophaga flava TaxID=3048013 RepID=A0AAE3QTX5_9BACT|nr:type 1 glutamine amidotransferase domain-containing protein [Xanthocytophaga flavus]